MKDTTVWSPAPNVTSTVEAFQIAAPAAVLIDRVVTPIWYAIGLIGNPITMKIWLSRRMRENNSSAIYLGAIAIVQFLFIFLHFFLELQLAWNIPTYNKPSICELFNFLYITPQYLSPLLIFGFTVERYIAVCHPFKKEKYCTVKRAVFVVCALTITSLCFGSMQTYIWTYNEEHTACVIRHGAKDFYDVWTWVSEMVVFALVPVLVLVFNVLVIREIKRITHRAMLHTPKGSNFPNTPKQTSTLTLLSVSFFLICTLLPATIVYTIQSLIPMGDFTLQPEDWPNDPNWQKYLTYHTIRKIVEELTFSNYACYVFIYYITGTHFRKEVHKLICFQLCRSKDIHKSKNSRAQSATSVNNHYTLVTLNGKLDGETEDETL